MSAYVLSAVVRPIARTWIWTVALGVGAIVLNGCTAGSSTTCHQNPSSCYTIGGTIIGLTAPSGSIGLDNYSPDLTGGQSFNEDTLAISSPAPNGTKPFTFPIPLDPGSAYVVSIFTGSNNFNVQNTTGENCVVLNAAGTTGKGALAGNVTNVLVSCAMPGAPTYSISGSVTGLSGSGLVMQDNVSHFDSGGIHSTNEATGPISSASPGFAFPTALPPGTTYDVTIQTQPAGQSCYVDRNGGGVLAGNVTVSVTCTGVTADYSIGGSVSGLTGTGLTLQDNGGDNIFPGPAVNAGTAVAAVPFTFPSTLPAGTAYNVSVLAQPAGEYCYPSAGGGGSLPASGAQNVTGVQIACIPSGSATYTVSGSISGLIAVGLVLADNGGDHLSVPADSTTFSFPAQLPANATHSVGIFQQPQGQTCSVTNPDGGAGSSPAIQCGSPGGNPVPVLTAISPATAPAAGGALTLTLTGSNFLSSSVVNLTSGGVTTVLTPTLVSATTLTATVPASLSASPATYSVTVANPAPGGGGSAAQTLTITATATYQIDVTVGGLTTGTVAVQNKDNTDIVTLSSNGTAILPTPLTSGTAYDVAVITQPTGQNCVVSNGIGTIGSANAAVTVSCSPSGVATASRLGVISNVPQGSVGTTYTAGISFFDISSALSPKAIGSQIVANGLAAPVTGMVLDASNNAYYLMPGAGGATLYYCPAPSGTAGYSCAASQPTITLPGGQWLAVDAAGNLYATEAQGSTNTVVKFTLTSTAPYPVVYSSANVVTAFLGLAVTPDGSTLYVGETTSASLGQSGAGTTMHLCTTLASGGCVNGTAGGTDITAQIAPIGNAGAISGAVAVSGPGGQYVYFGAANGNGTLGGSSPPTVLVVCPAKATPSSTTCWSGSQSYVLGPGNSQPYMQSAAVAADALGNSYVGALVNSNGSSLSGDPTLLGFGAPSGTSGLLTDCLGSSPPCDLSAMPAPASFSGFVPSVAIYSLGATTQ